MSSVSPSLVEAAARAMWECANADGRADPYARWADSPHQAQYRDEAEQALLAVGDALRLEGAQAERERIKAAIGTLPWMREDVLDVLGVHPEASDG